jgi:hypothetical protein
MPRGGARVNSGPPPDPHALRRDRKDDVAGWRTLPRGGRRGQTPKWPLLPDITRRALRTVAENTVLELEAELAEAETAKSRAAVKKRLVIARRGVTVLGMQIAEQDRNEKLLWVELWTTPHAAAWEELGWTRDVAQYVRHKVLAELGSLDDAKEARQWSDRLGLNPIAMLRNRWRVSIDELGARRAPATRAAKAAAKRASSRTRLKVVPGAGTE